ncbi:MAG: hypothetical protein K6F08_01545 [bacterium]|nr:hypothetical protein [bacterium]
MHFTYDSDHNDYYYPIYSGGADANYRYNGTNYSTPYYDYNIDSVGQYKDGGSGQYGITYYNEKYGRPTSWPFEIVMPGYDWTGFDIGQSTVNNTNMALLKKVYKNEDGEVVIVKINDENTLIVVGDINNNFVYDFTNEQPDYTYSVIQLFKNNNDRIIFSQTTFYDRKIRATRDNVDTGEKEEKLFNFYHYSGLTSSLVATFTPREYQVMFLTEIQSSEVEGVRYDYNAPAATWGFYDVENGELKNISDAKITVEDKNYGYYVPYSQQAGTNFIGVTNQGVRFSENQDDLYRFEAVIVSNDPDANITIKYGDTLQYFPVASKIGYRFLGWKAAVVELDNKHEAPNNEQLYYLNISKFNDSNTIFSVSYDENGVVSGYDFNSITTITADVDNECENTQIYFVAVYEEVGIDVVFEYYDRDYYDDYENQKLSSNKEDWDLDESQFLDGVTLERYIEMVRIRGKIRVDTVVKVPEPKNVYYQTVNLWPDNINPDPNSEFFGCYYIGDCLAYDKNGKVCCVNGQTNTDHTLLEHFSILQFYNKVYLNVNNIFGFENDEVLEGLKADAFDFVKTISQTTSYRFIAHSIRVSYEVLVRSSRDFFTGESDNSFEDDDFSNEIWVNEEWRRTDCVDHGFNGKNYEGETDYSYVKTPQVDNNYAFVGNPASMLLTNMRASKEAEDNYEAKYQISQIVLDYWLDETYPDEQHNTQASGVRLVYNITKKSSLYSAVTFDNAYWITFANGKETVNYDNYGYDDLSTTERSMFLEFIGADSFDSLVTINTTEGDLNIKYDSGEHQGQVRVANGLNISINRILFGRITSKTYDSTRPALEDRPLHQKRYYTTPDADPDHYFDDSIVTGITKRTISVFPVLTEAKYNLYGVVVSDSSYNSNKDHIENYANSFASQATGNISADSGNFVYQENETTVEANYFVKEYSKFNPYGTSAISFKLDGNHNGTDYPIYSNFPTNISFGDLVYDLNNERYNSVLDLYNITLNWSSGVDGDNRVVYIYCEIYINNSTQGKYAIDLTNKVCRYYPDGSAQETLTDNTKIFNLGGALLSFGVSNIQGGLFTLNLTYEINKESVSSGDYITIGDKVFVVTFGEFRGSSYSVYATFDGYNNVKIAETADGQKRSATDATNSVTLNNNFNGYYLKNVYVTYNNDKQLVAKVYPSIVSNELRYSIYYYDSVNNSGESTLKIIASPITIEFGANQDGGQTSSSTRTWYNIVVKLYGTYANVKIDCEYESIMLLQVNNPIVQFQNGNGNDLDYKAVVNYNNSLQFVTRSLQQPGDAETIGTATDALYSHTNSIYYSDSGDPSFTSATGDTFTLYVLIGNVGDLGISEENNIATNLYNINNNVGFENGGSVTCDIINGYSNFIEVNSITMPNNIEVESQKRGNNNKAVINLRKKLTTITVNFDAGYYADKDNNGEDEWYSYKDRQQYVKKNDDGSYDYSVFNSLLETRFKQLGLTFEYYGKGKNPKLRESQQGNFVEFANILTEKLVTEDSRKNEVSANFTIYIDRVDDKPIILITLKRSGKVLAITNTEDVNLFEDDFGYITTKLLYNDNQAIPTLVVRFIAKSYDIVYDVNRAVRNENDVLPNYVVTLNGGGIQTSINKDATPQTVKVEDYHFDDIIDSDSFVNAFYGLSANAVSGIKFYGWRIAGEWSEPITETSPYGILLDENNFILYSLENSYIETQTENSASRAAFATTVKSAQNNLVNFLPEYNSEIKAYAIWKIEKATIKIFANDNDGGSTIWNRGSTKSFELTYHFGDYFLFIDNGVVKFNNEGTKVDLPTRLGYRLLGFDESANPTGVLDYLIYDANDQVITDSIVTVVGTLNLYCYWQAKVYTVKFELDEEIPDLFIGTSYGAGVSYYVYDLLTIDNIDNATNARVQIGFDKVLSIPNVSCVGYNFTGWENEFAKINMSGDDADKRVYPNTNSKLTYDFFDKSVSTISDDTVIVFKATWVRQYVKVVVYYSPEHNLGGSEAVFNSISNDANTDVAWIDKDYNGTNNGVTKTLPTRATTTDDSYVVSGIQFNINIPYLLDTDLAGLSENDAKDVPIPITVPEACGYVFDGLYYHDPDNGNDIKYFNKNGELCHKWDIAWDNLNPVVLYAKWIMNEYKVSIKIDPVYSWLFNGIGLSSSPNNLGWSSADLPDQDNLQSSLRLVYTVYDQNNKAIEGKTNIEIASPQIKDVYLKFYQKLVVNLTMAEGHYLYSIGGNEISYTASENGFIADRNYTFYSDPANRKGTLDKYSVSFNRYALRDEGQDSTGKQDSTITIDRAVASYDFTLEFDRQTFNISVIPVLFNDKKSTSGAPHNEWKVDYSNVPYLSRITIVNPNFGGDTIFYNNDNKLYSDSSCNQPISNVTPEAIRNINIYCKLIFTNVSESQVRFYEYKGGDYKVIQTGRNYVAISTSNGIRINESEYDWSDSIDGQTILNLPIATSFYWPDMIDDNENVRFLYWVNLGDDLKVSYADLGLRKKPITPDVLLQHFTIQQLKNVILIDCAGGFSFTGNPEYYAVYDIPDRKLEMTVNVADELQTDENGQFDIANTIDDYIIYNFNAGGGGTDSESGASYTVPYGGAGFYKSLQLSFPIDKSKADKTINNFGYITRQVMVGTRDITKDCVMTTDGSNQVSKIVIKVPAIYFTSNNRTVTVKFIDTFGQVQKVSFTLGLAARGGGLKSGSNGGVYLVSTDAEVTFTSKFTSTSSLVTNATFSVKDPDNQVIRVGAKEVKVWTDEWLFKVGITYYQYKVGAGKDYYTKAPDVNIKPVIDCAGINGKNLFKDIPDIDGTNGDFQVKVKGKVYNLICYTTRTRSENVYSGIHFSGKYNPQNKEIWELSRAGSCVVKEYFRRTNVIKESGSVTYSQEE